MQNEPNSARLGQGWAPVDKRCETKPNLGGLGHLGMVRAKQSQLGNEIVQDKPNLGRAAGARDLKSPAVCRVYIRDF